MATTYQKKKPEPPTATTNTQPEFGHIEIGSDEFKELIRAAGNACVGLGSAINGLAKSGDATTCRDLAKSLLMTSKVISWNLKLAMNGRTDGDGNT